MSLRSASDTEGIGRRSGEQISQATRVPRSEQRPSLLGRDSERALLDGLVAAVRQGESRSLVLRGEAGIGKTALLQYLIESASDVTVVRAAGVESEMELAYAGLHQLSAPVLDRLEMLPEPQRQALEIVFGLSCGGAPDPFLVGLAVLSLLSDAADERPLLCVVDDAQWLDQASALTLSFVARRLLADPVGIVFAARELSEELQHLSELEVKGLTDADARALLGSSLQLKLDERVRDRIIAETHGNPLALLELPRRLTPTELAGGFGFMDARHLPERVQQSFVRRLDGLSDDARRLLLLAAAEPVGDPLLLQRASEQLGIAISAIDTEARTDGLLALGERVTFRHPLVRSAVYGSAGAQERRAVHLALAQATDRDVDPDRRAWHLAAAAAGPDEGVALELEQSAGRAQARGGLAAAAALLERAVALSAAPARRIERALAAAEASLNAGLFEPARRLLLVAQAGPLDELGRGRLELLQGMAAYAERRGSDAPPLLLRAAQTLEPLDPRVARETYLDAWAAALFAGQLATAGDLYGVSREARRAPSAAEPARPCDVLLDGFALLLTDGRAAATAVLQQAATGFTGDGVTVEEVLRWGWLATIGAVVVWDYESCVAIANRDVELAREHGALTVLAVALNILAQALAMGGEFGRAAQLISEADAVREATGTQVLQYGALYLAAFSGREAEVSKLSEATVREGMESGQGTAIQYTWLATAVALNGLGRYREAVASACKASNAMPELVVAGWALTELIEASARSGETELAHSALERLAERNQYIATDWGRGVEARSRALLAEGQPAECLYREAVDRLGRTRLRPELARAHLLYGEWLRRENRRLHAREQLGAAYDQFMAIGMEAFAERARIELSATGHKVRKRTVETRDDLTAHERRIAELACDGLSNPEIGARLFLSQRTVEWHLRKVFGKLGIHRRRELAVALSGRDSELRPV
jgi:DNA-binding CsgD family transcriptional regulator